MNYASSSQTFSKVDEGLSNQADRTVQAATDAVDGARQTAKLALDAGRSYATDAVNAAGQKMNLVKGQAERLSGQTVQFVTDQPLRAIAYAAAAGFLLAVLLNGLRGPR